MTIGPRRLIEAIAARARAFFVSFWNAIPDHRPGPLKHIDHQFVQSSSSEFSIPSQCVDPRNYVDPLFIPFPYWW